MKKIKCSHEPLCGATVVRLLREEKDFLEKYCYGEWRKCVHLPIAKAQVKKKESSST